MERMAGRPLGAPFFCVDHFPPKTINATPVIIRVPPASLSRNPSSRNRKCPYRTPNRRLNPLTAIMSTMLNVLP